MANAIGVCIGRESINRGRRITQPTLVFIYGAIFLLGFC